MSSSYFITPKKECSTCEHAQFYGYGDSKYQFICFHPKRNDPPRIRIEGSKRNKSKMLDTSSFKPCPFLARKAKKVKR